MVECMAPASTSGWKEEGGGGAMVGGCPSRGGGGEEEQEEEEEDFAQRPLHQAKNTSFEEKKLFEKFLVKSNTFSSYWKFLY